MRGRRADSRRVPRGAPRRTRRPDEACDTWSAGGHLPAETGLRLEPTSRPRRAALRGLYPEWKPFENEALKGKAFGDKAWFGKRGVEYVAFIGLRGDEPHRMQRVEARNDTAAGYEGEHVYMPLNDMTVTRDDINAFRERQNWDLALPKDTSLSNCVYCFLKGAANLGAIHAGLEDAPDTEVRGSDRSPTRHAICGGG